MQDLKLLEYLKEYLTPRRRALFQKVIAERTNYLTIVAQDVYQLHNTSAVIRSCDVFGVQNVHIVEERKPQRIDKEIAMGAQKWVDVNRYNSTKKCIGVLRNKGYSIVATSPHHNSGLLEDFKIEKPIALFFGTEQQGLSDEVFEAADHTLQIPMVGFTESLNISVSAAIFLNSLTQKLKRSKLKWQLSEEEKIELEWQWTKKCIKNSEEIIHRYKNS
ncbi:RNA methyltransferase [Gramella sp. AN32]|uniref:tRNA (guanosine(18)-2'-O)-methyltransferase n=1 Tax=Christiangramia antarctica TaxID=2058158 RepID=A0ABW5XCB9_9FLAO|nr:RNA methyltransferase [Gramella sp. AN32]MCM4156494.1 rRNA methyltransferase [Gramella sp. AN32]